MSLNSWIQRSFLSVCLVLTTCLVMADSPKIQEELKTKLAKRFNGTAITSIRQTPMKGIYEVVIGKKTIVYTNGSGDYVIAGEMIDTAKHESLTRQRYQEISRVDFGKLPLGQAIKEVRGNGSRKLAVFTDPDCSFCKQLERDSFKGLSDVTIYSFLMPIGELHADAARKSQIIWCAANRDAAWKDWILNDKLPKDGKSNCENPIQKNVQLGSSLGFEGTPMLVLEDGSVLPGALPKEEIEKALGAHKKKYTH